MPREKYQERKQLGRLLVPQILKAINFDLKNTIFSYIPNTAETSFLGMMAGIEEYMISKQKEIILDGKPSVDSLEDILSFRPRIEKIVLKDVKLRTFITDDAHRDDMVAHVYDTTYEVVNKGKDTLKTIVDQTKYIRKLVGNQVGKQLRVIPELNFYIIFVLLNKDNSCKRSSLTFAQHNQPLWLSVLQGSNSCCY